MELVEYLDVKGVLTCNVNPWLPSLSDTGFNWNDVVSAIDSHRMFYCKAYRKRTIYLSTEVYFLLSRLKRQKPLPGSSEAVYWIVSDLGPMDIQKIKASAVMDRTVFDKAFSFLLEQMYVTAWSGGKVINPNWSAFEYCTAQAWEAAAEPFKAEVKADPVERLWELLSGAMTEKEFTAFIK